MKRYYVEFKDILHKIREHKITNQDVLKYLRENIDFDFIHELEGGLSTDIFYSIYHWALDEDGFAENEIEYFLQCLERNREYSLEEKMTILQESQLREL